eukprot:483398-Pyramimonas_sp.AAC.1
MDCGSQDGERRPPGGAAARQQQEQRAQQPSSGVDASVAQTAFGLPVPDDLGLEHLRAPVASNGGKVAEGE